MLRYIIRSLKCLIIVGIMFTLVVLIMFYTSEHDANLRPWNLFDGNWTKVILFFVAYAGVYPLIGYSKRDVAFGDGFSERRQEIAGVLRDMNFVPEDIMKSENPEVLRLHNNSGIIRALRLWEDTLTLTGHDGMITVEGQRKDVVRASMRIENYLASKS
ncbi:MAG: hypothetical protein IJK39_05320 [Bacteroidales bacterium]|nr:hypothetical protein [Bacteroidales bacterium]MBR0314529.1 hypothetical protein [Bacteroidales bacterium]MBR6971631.1 hypothetical protein [Bacteroidales bacterium]